METAEAEYTIINALGLHARAAAQLVKAANKYPCDVELECEGQPVNGKSIMGVLMLAAAVNLTRDGQEARRLAHPALDQYNRPQRQARTRERAKGHVEERQGEPDVVAPPLEVRELLDDVAEPLVGVIEADHAPVDLVGKVVHRPDAVHDPRHPV